MLFLLKVFFFTFDYWTHNRRVDSNTNIYVNIKNNALHKLFKAKNHYVFTFGRSIEELNKIRGFDYTRYRDKIIFDTNIWCSYRSSKISFNQNPICKIFVSGAIHKIHYPERHLLKMKSKEDKNIVVDMKSINERYRDSLYVQRLRKYLCCFASSVHVFYATKKKYRNTHLILQKIFKILKPGSLLLCPKTEEPYLNEIGLIDGVNMKVVDMKSFDTVIKEILDYKNRKNIDRIRLEGYKLAQTKFTSENKFQEIMEKINRYTMQTLDGVRLLDFNNKKDSYLWNIIKIFRIDRVFFH